MQKKNIVVLGGGFGGIRAALDIAAGLKKHRLLERYQVVLVDRHEYHLYTPLLPDLAVPPRHPADAVEEERVARTFKDILRGHPVTFIHGEVEALDLERGDLHLSRGEELTCEYLVLAPGSESNYFGIPGLKEHSLPLKTLADGRKLRDTLSELLEVNPAPRIVVGGGGPTGIEVAAQIKYNYPQARVGIVEASPVLLAGFDPRLQRAALRRLHELKVALLLNDPVAGLEADIVKTKSGQAISFDLFVWTGGVKAPSFLATLPLKTEPHGRVEVAPAMRCLPQNLDLQLSSMVYALGDGTCVYDPKTGKPMPGVAPSAIEQGHIAARNIITDILNAEDPKRKIPHVAYWPKNHPYVLTAGGRWGAAKIGPVVVTGWIAWAFKWAIDVHYSLSLR